ncbi:MAG TPA: hypothetical protein VNT32_03435, partial [Thermoleophilaceae bacterium]|nr:hypothetical protein [Thermoleophilaceae bacterium]
MSRPDEAFGIRAAAFAALCAFGAGHWAGLVAEPPATRLAAVAGIAALCGVLVAATPRLPLPAAWRHVAALALAAAATALALGATGLELRLLLPGNWGEL